MKPVIYTANRCHQCALVKDFVKNSGVATTFHNVDMSFAKPPIDVFVYPVLFIDHELIAYGEDIIRYYKEKLIG